MAEEFLGGQDHDSDDGASSDDLDEILEQSAPGDGGYGFEPLMTRELREAREESRRKRRCFNKLLGQLLDDTRLTSTAGWCGCNKCSIATLRQPKEAFCCREVVASTAVRKKVSKKLGQSECITLNSTFEKCCLDKDVLKIVAIEIARKVKKLSAVDFQDTRTFRNAAYVAYTNWLYGKLGANIRRIIPACVVSKIREAFEDPQKSYVGYKSAGESDEEDQ